MSVTSWERVRAAIDRRVVDRPPVALWRHFPRADATAAGLAAAVASFQAEYGFDLVKVTPASSYPAEAWGAELEAADNEEGTRRHRRRVVNSTEDWWALEPLETDDPVLGRELDALARVKAAVGEDVPVVQTVFSPLTVAKQLAGDEALLRAIADHPGALDAALPVIAGSMRAFARRCLDVADGVFFATQFARRDLLDPAQYARFGEAFDRPLCADVGAAGRLLVLHLCGREPMFELADRYGADIVNWEDQTTPPSLADGLEVRRRGAVMGGLDRRRLADEGASYARRAAGDAARVAEGRGVIVGAGCVTLVTTPPDAIRAARDTVSDWQAGGHP